MLHYGLRQQSDKHLNTKSRTIRVPAHKTHIPDVGPKVSQLDPTYQGTYESQI